MNTKIYLFGSNEAVNYYTNAFSQIENVQVSGSTQANIATKEIVLYAADFAFYILDGSSNALRVAQQIYMLFPQCVNVAICSEEYLKNNITALSQSGIHYYFNEETKVEAIMEELNDIQTVEQNRIASVTGTANISSYAEIFTFYGPKGGLGKTTFVVNLAIALARLNKKILVLDCDLQFGDVATVSGIDNKATIAELLQEQPNPNINMIRKYLLYHKTGINILAAPKNVEYAEKITTEHIEKILSTVRPYYDYILIDTSDSFNEVLLQCCEQSSEIFMFTRADISTLMHTKQCLTLFDSLAQKEKIRMINFKLQKAGRITKADVSRVLGLDVWQEIPFDNNRTTDSINKGNPIIVDYPNSTVSKCCEAIAKEIVGSKKENGGKKLFGRK